MQLQTLFYIRSTTKTIGMKKTLLISFLATSLILGRNQSSAQSRYLDEVFQNVQVTSNVVYGENMSVLTGTPDTVPLIMDVYQPQDDWIAARPLIIYLHTGSFLPILINGTATGDMHDSATVEMCKEFARRGYTAVSMDYRVGWNPIGSTQDIRTGTLLQAVYRAIQDAKTCVRYFKMTVATQGNPWHIDTSKIILAGQGSGGYVTLAYATLDKPSEIALQKFIATATDPTYGFVAGQPYVNQSVMGDFGGLGGLPGFNIPNWPGYSDKANFVVNMGGALGDISWMEAGDAPMVCFHVTNDPYAPYGSSPCECSCPVIVPTTGQFVVDVAGSRCTERKADDTLNNNAAFHLYSDNATDPYTLRANAINEGFEGLFPFEMIDPSLVIPGDPFHGQAGPWEWWDSTDLQIIAPFYGISATQAATTYLTGFLTNPDMSKAKGLAYIDTMQGYLAPRLVVTLNLDTMHINVGVENISQDFQFSVLPVPATDFTTITMEDPSQKIQYLKIFDVSGKEVRELNGINNHQIKISRTEIPPGIYFVKIGLKTRELNSKLIFQ